MAQDCAARFLSRAPRWDGAGGSARLLVLAWILLASATLMLLVPARYTASTTLSFDVAAQPAPATVRGIMQMLTSREMTFDVLDRLSRTDAAWLAQPRGILPALLAGEERSARDRAAARLGKDLAVTAHHGGRTLEIAATASRPDLAARIVQAYSETFAALQAGARSRTPDMADAIPLLSMSTAVHTPAMRDLPPLPASLGLAGLALALGILTAHLNRRSAIPAHPVDHDLPHQAAPIRRVAWMDAGRGAGLTCADAVRRLAEQVRADRGKPGAQLIVLTSEALPDASATCAIGLARLLSEESRVALVALDGASGDLAALIADPWAPGMGEMLFGVAGFGETIHRDPHSRAHVIPPGRDARSGPSVVGADRLTLILNALRQTYDFVVVAAPVLGGTAGAANLAGLSPYVVCIEEAGEGSASVEAYDALAAQGFGHVLMLRIDTAQGPVPFLEETGAPRLVPSLSAA